jgi:hypothetical protein
MIRLVVVALLVAGCALVPSPAESGPLVTLEAHGGRCLEGECRTLVAIEADGLVHQIEPVEAEIHRATNEAVDVYQAAVAITDFDAIRSRPFTGECPTAFDGQELIYTFATPAGPERIASCEVEINPDEPLFATIHSIIGPNVPKP